MPSPRRTVLQFSVVMMLSLSATQGHAFGRLVNLAQVEAGAAYNGFIVRFKDGSAEQSQVTAVTTTLGGLNARLKARKLLGAGPDGQAKAFALRHGRRMAGGADVVRLSRHLARTEGSILMRELAALPNVDYVEPNLRVKAALVPNDGAYPSQWALVNPLTGVRPQAAWDLARGAGVTVAVLDSGITNHADLNANVVPGYDFIADLDTANDGNGRDSNASDPGDWCVSQSEPSDWHGTHVAGTIAAVGNNNQLVTGLAYEAKVMPVRVLGTCGGDIADVADAITWASGGAVANVPTLTAAKVAKVINLSLQSSGACSASLQQAVDGAIRRGVTLVAAAGNGNLDVASVQPANCGSVIAVAAHTEDGFRATFSNHGVGVALSAPGQNIVSTSNLGRTAPDAGTLTLASLSGTSMAAPHVSAVAALIQGFRLSQGQPRLHPTVLASVLTGSTRPLPNACPEGCGSGMLDAKAAIDAGLLAGAPALVTVGTDNQTRLQQYLGAPLTAVAGNVAVVSAAVSSTLGPVAIGSNGRLYARAAFDAGDWQAVASFNNVAMLSVSSMPDGSLLGVGFSRALYTRASLAAPWLPVTGSNGVDSAAALPDGSVVGVGSSDHMLRVRATLGGPWVTVANSGWLKAVAVLSNGTIVGLGSAGRLYQRASVNAPWQALGGVSTINNIASTVY